MALKRKSIEQEKGGITERRDNRIKKDAPLREGSGE